MPPEDIVEQADATPRDTARTSAPPEDIVGRLLALPPHVGALLDGENAGNALRCLLALTVEADEARKVLQSREREAQSVDREKSAAIVEQAIRKRLNKPTGEITREDRASITELNLRETQVSDLSPLAGLPKVKVVIHKGRDIRIPPELEGRVQRV
jgi:hypothetical protein